MKRMLIITAALLAVTYAQAADYVSRLDRFLDEGTLVVARIDGTKVNIAAAAELAHETLKEGAPEAAAAVMLGAQTVETRLKEFLALGGRDALVVFTLNDLPEDEPRLLIPVHEGVDVQDLMDMLRSVDVPTTKMSTLDDVLWVGDTTLLPGIEKATPTPRPEVAAALQAVDGAAVQIAITPPKYTARLVADFIPTLPAPCEGKPTTVLIDGLQWLAIGVASPPEPSIRIVIQSKDEHAAAAFQELLVDAIDFARQWLAEKAPEMRPDERVLAPIAIDALGQLRPQVRGDRVIMELDNVAIQRLLKLATPAVIEARRGAERTAVASQMKCIAQAIYMYAADHKSVTPESLDVLVENKSITEDLIRTDGVARVEYLAPSINTSKIKDAYKVIMLYERYDAWPPCGVFAAYADGHIEAVTDETQMKDLIERSRKEFARVRESNE